MMAPKLCHEAIRRGLRLELRGDRFAVIPAKRCPPEFVDELRQHKREILNWLEACAAAGLRPDELPWLHIARQVLAGEFDGCDRSTCESLVIGLRGIQHQTCLWALNQLNNRKVKP